jgi:hypothetical protein
MASRICPQCGQEAPQTAKFCPQCAAPFAGSTATLQPTQPIRPNKKLSRSSIILIGSLSAAVVVLASATLLALKASSVVHTPVPSPVTAPPIAQVSQAPLSAPPIAQAPSTPLVAPPIMQAPTAPTTSAPADVVNYLAFIQQMEQTRTNLEAEQTAAILPLLGTANGLKTDMGDDSSDGSGSGESTAQQGASQINQGMTNNLQKWQALIKQFQSVTPPGACSDLANDYYKLLNDYTDLCSEIQVALAKGDYAKIMGLQSAQTIVDQDATRMVRCPQSARSTISRKAS